MNIEVKMVEAVESTESVQERKWRTQRTIFRRKLTEVSLWVAGVTVTTALVMFTAGALSAYAAPGGWAAYRVGILAGGITTMVVFVIATLCGFIWVSEQKRTFS